MLPLVVVTVQCKIDWPLRFHVAPTFFHPGPFQRCFSVFSYMAVLPALGCLMLPKWTKKFRVFYLSFASPCPYFCLSWVISSKTFRAQKEALPGSPSSLSPLPNLRTEYRGFAWRSSFGWSRWAPTPSPTMLLAWGVTPHPFWRQQKNEIPRFFWFCLLCEWKREPSHIVLFDQLPHCGFRNTGYGYRCAAVHQQAMGIQSMSHAEAVGQNPDTLVNITQRAFKNRHNHRVLGFIHKKVPEVLKSVLTKVLILTNNWRLLLLSQTEVGSYLRGGREFIEWVTYYSQDN